MTNTSIMQILNKISILLAIFCLILISLNILATYLILPLPNDLANIFWVGFIEWLVIYSILAFANFKKLKLAILANLVVSSYDYHSGHQFGFSLHYLFNMTLQPKLELLAISLSILFSLIGTLLIIISWLQKTKLNL